MTSRRYPPTAYYLLVTTAVALSLFGVVMVLNASSVHAYANYGDTYHFVKRQLVSLILGFAGMYATFRIGYKRLVKYAPLIVGGTAFFLVLTHIPGVGLTAKGASRSINIGPIPIQPSEPAKLAIILYAAGVLADRGRKIRNIKELIANNLPVFGIIVLVLFQPDLGTTILITAAFLTMIFMGGARWRDVAGLLAAAAAAAAAFAMTATYRRNRLLAFINPSADPQGIGYQIRQSLIAIGSGGLTGVGLGMSRQKFFFLPEAHTDFIFAIIGEELGLIGCLLVVAGFSVLAYAGFSIAFKTDDYLGKVLAAGITASITGQAFINLGAVTGIMPVTGVPLPLISFGGTSLVVTLSLIGILMDIASHGGRVRSKRSDEGDNKRRRDGRTRLSGTRAPQGARVG